jgi:hypothetical protein
MMSPAFARYEQELRGIDRLDLAVLKAHILIEQSIRYLLAARLRADVAYILKVTERTPSVALLDLAICEPEMQFLTKALLMMNDARVHVAHRFDLAGYTKYVHQLIRYAGETEPGQSDTKVLKQFKNTAGYLLAGVGAIEDEIRGNVYFSTRSKLRKMQAAGEWGASS